MNYLPYTEKSNDDNILQLWHENWLGKSKKLAEAKVHLIEHLKSCQLEVAQFILTYQGFSNDDEKTPREFSCSDIKLLTDTIFAASKSTAQATDQIIVLGLALAFGNKHGLWYIPVPPMPVHVKPEKNPFQPNRFVPIKRTRQWEKTFIQSLKENIDLSDDALIGRILLSAITRGGLLQKDTLIAFMQHINKPLIIVKDTSCFHLTLRWQGQDDQENRTWFPDPLTESLLLTNQVKITHHLNDPWFYIKAFFKGCGLQSNQAPTSITMFLNGMALTIELSMPMFIAQYATRKNISHSLTPDVLYRLNGVANDNQESNPDAPLPITSDDEESFTDYGDETWNKDIKMALRTDTTQEAVKILKAIQPRKDIPLHQYILGWCLYLIQHGSSLQRTLRIGTIRNYVSRISTRLYGTIGDQDLITFNIEAFEDIYTQILEEEDKSRRTIARILSQFHHYLVKEHQCPELDNSVLGISNTLTSVDANIISVDELYKTFTCLNQGDLDLIHPDLNTIAKLLTAISFFCGLRRSEILKLRLIDVHASVAPELLIRPHATRRLKTKSSTRRVLLYCLLPKKLLQAFMDWLEKRKQQEQNKPYSEYVFSIPDKQYAFVPEELIFPAIHRALRQATGDESLRFHSLRHSCASWNILRLMCAEHGVPQQFFDHMPFTKQWLEGGVQFKQKLYLHQKPTRKHLYTITSILGHANPSITLEHYIHWCDVLLHHNLQHHLKPIEKQIWVNATQMKQATVYRILKNNGLHALITSLRKKYKNKLVYLKKSKGSESALNNDSSNNSIISLLNIWKLLYLYSKHDLSLETLAERYGLTTNEAKQIVANAQNLQDLKSSDRHKSPRIRFMTSNDGRVLLCPRKPTTYQGDALAKDFAIRLDTLKNEAPETYTFMLDYYIQHSRQKSNDLVFRNIEDAKRFYQALLQMKITKKHITFTWHHGKNINELSNSQRKQHWRKGLNLTKHQKLGEKKINNTRPLGKYGQLSIRIQDYLYNPSDLTQATEAFRFVFIMQSIIDNLRTLSNQQGHFAL